MQSGTDRGVSDVTGGVLALALVLLVAVLVSGFALGTVLPSAPGPTAQFSFARVGAGDLLVTHEVGDTVDGAELYVLRAGDPTPVGTWAGAACVDPVATVHTGDYCLVPGAATGAGVLVVWRPTPDDGGTVLGRWTNPGRPAVTPPTQSPPATTVPPTTYPTTQGGDGGAGSSGGGDGSSGGGSSSGGGIGADDGPTVIAGPGRGVYRFDDPVAWTARAAVGDRWDLHLAPSNPSANRTWTSGTVEDFEVRYNASAGLVRLAVGNESVTQQIGGAPDGALSVTVRATDANGDGTPDGAASVAALALDGRPLSRDHLTTGDGGRNVVIRDAGTADGFVLRGTVRFTWPEGTTPGDGGLELVVDAEG